jgi:hypothetical protein
MAKNKTTETVESVNDFIRSVPDEKKQSDSFKIVEIMKNASGYEPRMWGPSIVGFGSYHYKYESGHEGDAPLAGFSPRKDAISIYLGLAPEQRQELLKKFGKYKSGKACIYIKKLDDVNIDVFREMVIAGINNLRSKYPSD